MSPTLWRRCGAVVLSGLFLTSLAHAQGLKYPKPVGGQGCGGCSACGSDCAYKVCKRSDYKPPCYHESVPFGYYATAWARWPTDCVRPAATADGAPPLAPEGPATNHAEPLPPPRPLDMSRSPEGPRIPRLVSAGYPQKR